MKRNICMSISRDPSFCGRGKGSCGTGTPRNLQHTAKLKFLSYCEVRGSPSPIYNARLQLMTMQALYGSCSS